MPQKRFSSMLYGTLTGLGVGAAIGGLIGLIAPDRFDYFFSDLLVYSLVGVIVGFVIGTAVDVGKAVARKRNGKKPEGREPDDNRGGASK